MNDLIPNYSYFDRESNLVDEEYDSASLTSDGLFVRPKPDTSKSKFRCYLSIPKAIWLHRKLSLEICKLENLAIEYKRILPHFVGEELKRKQMLFNGIYWTDGENAGMAADWDLMKKITQHVIKSQEIMQIYIDKYKETDRYKKLFGYLEKQEPLNFVEKLIYKYMTK